MARGGALAAGRAAPHGRVGQLVLELTQLGLGALDLALVPIWGWGPRAGPGHMGPAEAARSLALLRPALAVPIHWGTFLPIGRGGSLGHLLRDPVRAFVELSGEAAPGVRIEVVEPGGSLVIPAARP